MRKSVPEYENDHQEDGRFRGKCVPMGENAELAIGAIRVFGLERGERALRAETDGALLEIFTLMDVATDGA